MNFNEQIWGSDVFEESVPDDEEFVASDASQMHVRTKNKANESNTG